MSGKIEISRGLVERLLNFTCNEEYDELRALLAAQVVERQPVAIDERAEFENYYRERIMGNRTGVRFLRSASGSYLDSEVREMWSGWQARACLDKELNQ